MTNKERLIEYIEAAMDEGLAKHIPITSQFLADRLVRCGVVVAEKTAEED